MKVFGSAFVIS